MYKAIFRFLCVTLFAGSLAVMNLPAQAADGALLELLKIPQGQGGYHAAGIRVAHGHCPG